MRDFSFDTGRDFKGLRRWLTRMHRNPVPNLDRYGRKGVEELASATPTDTGLTAASWKYEISRDRRSSQVVWYNTNTVNGIPLAVLLHYGHATGTGGWVSGRHYIHKAINPVIREIAKDSWEGVRRG